MAINLQKGQRIEVGLTKITIGLGWDPNEGTGNDFDLDASAFMIDQFKQIPAEPFFIFYGNTDSPDGALHHTGDDPTGGNSADGDDESIQVDLSKVDSRITEISFVVTIHDAIARRQNYGQVRNSYIRIVDDSNGQEVAKYELGEDFSLETAVEFGRLYRRNDSWKFEASGMGYKEDLAFFLSKYYKGQIIK
ncbi:TerD family protein [Sphingobacterium siyangense]|jgi:tellurium resistance protein TerD|uniref:TerD family protein n=1 Tax=Sphingobacterium TaxID=28453 RepID=UPI00062772E1|nr:MULTISPECIES: TerD family protein [Sphingobacterium]APU96286.1 chemical-damaging agent resistance protein C [Sphingobacterium sp. B29]KKO90786.1 chemical-damaging agent resistance protein C [Sphingobacterium sp. Ag1]QQT31969.1 TerD family protein [Sphingobacterium multivorum]UQA76662.1 TerD family protein [Sphingobacterium siyangense]